MEDPRPRRSRHRADGDAAPHCRADDRQHAVARHRHQGPTRPRRSALQRRARPGRHLLRRCSRNRLPRRPGRLAGHHRRNSSSIGVEAENTGVGEPWPEVQVDAYARLCAAVLSHVGAAPIMAVAHREWALPKGRKIDPAGIDMTAFRARVAGVMNGAPVRPLVPAKDTTGRPTLRRGASGETVKALQAAIGLTADGDFGPATEAGLRAWQRAHGLVADGIAGPAPGPRSTAPRRPPDNRPGFPGDSTRAGRASRASMIAARPSKTAAAPSKTVRFS